MTVGQLIKKHRKRLKLTQKKLGAMRGYGWQTICNWEASPDKTNHRSPKLDDFLWLGRLFGEEFQSDVWKCI